MALSGFHRSLGKLKYSIFPDYLKGCSQVSLTLYEVAFMHSNECVNDIMVLLHSFGNNEVRLKDGNYSSCPVSCLDSLLMGLIDISLIHSLLFPQSEPTGKRDIPFS